MLTACPDHHKTLAMLRRPDLRKLVLFHPDNFEAAAKLKNIDVVVVFCPVLYGLIRTALPEINLVLPIEATLNKERLWKKSAKLARAASYRLNSALSDIIGADKLEFWQFDYYNNFCYHVHRWNEIASNFSKIPLAGEFLIPGVHTAWRYGFSSYIPTQAFIDKLSGQVELSVFQCNNSGPRNLLKIPSEINLESFEGGDQLAYLPATHRHADVIASLISDKATLITPPYYETSYSKITKKIELRRVSKSEIKSVIKQVRSMGIDLKTLFYLICNDLLESVIFPMSLLAQQRKAFMSDFICQLLTLANLRSNTQSHASPSLLLSSHESVFSGPLMSFVLERNGSVDVFPHSYFPTHNWPAVKNLKLWSHFSSQYHWSSFYQDWVKTHVSRNFDYKGELEGLVANRGFNLKRVLILLNGTTSFTPLPDLQRFLTDLRQIVEALLRLGIEVSIRPKPNSNYMKFLDDFLFYSTTVTGYENEDLGKLICGHDLVLMFDALSSAGVQALQSKCPVVFCSSATDDPAADISYLDESLVRRFEVANLLSTIEEWVLNPGAFREFAELQNMNYFRSCSGL